MDIDHAYLLTLACLTVTAITISLRRNASQRNTDPVPHAGSSHFLSLLFIDHAI